MLGIEEAAKEPDELNIARALHELGRCVRANGQPAAAEDYFRRSLEIKENAMAHNDPELAETLFKLGQCMREAARPEEAEEYFQVGSQGYDKVDQFFCFLDGGEWPCPIPLLL